jgi:hypothetical protein
MGKLIFQDEEGINHEISLTHVPVQKIKSGDVVVVSYEVGQAIPKDVGGALTQLKKIFDQILPAGVNNVVLATRNGKKDVSIKIMKDETGEQTPTD